MGTFRKKLGRHRKYKKTVKKSKMGRKFKGRKISKYTRKQGKKNRNRGSKKMLGGLPSIIPQSAKDIGSSTKQVKEPKSKTADKMAFLGFFSKRARRLPWNFEKKKIPFYGMFSDVKPRKNSALFTLYWSSEDKSIGDKSIGDKSIGDESIGDKSIGDESIGDKQTGNKLDRKITAGINFFEDTTLNNSDDKKIYGDIQPSGNFYDSIISIGIDFNLLFPKVILYFNRYMNNLPETNYTKWTLTDLVKYRIIITALNNNAHILNRDYHIVNRDDLYVSIFKQIIEELDKIISSKGNPDNYKEMPLELLREILIRLYNIQSPDDDPATYSPQGKELIAAIKNKFMKEHTIQPSNDTDNPYEFWNLNQLQRFKYDFYPYDNSKLSQAIEEKNYIPPEPEPEPEPAPAPAPQPEPAPAPAPAPKLEPDVFDLARAEKKTAAVEAANRARRRELDRRMYFGNDHIIGRPRRR